MTQAGGRLDPDAVRRWSSFGRGHGWDLVVMYGATEATARMAYLPPHLTEHHPAAIGVAIPGGRLRLDEGVDERAGVGELVYAGPNVMLGYAESSADLALGREVVELRTGDLARETDGVFEVVGRLNRHGKVFGLRLDLDGHREPRPGRGRPSRPGRGHGSCGPRIPHESVATARSLVTWPHVTVECPCTPCGPPSSPSCR